MRPNVLYNLFGFYISQRDGGMINIEAERFPNNDDGGGESFRLWIGLFIFPFNTSQRDETMINIDAEKRE